MSTLRVNNLQDLSSNSIMSIGYGQTWQDVSASRAANTAYTNSTGRPIMVIVAGTLVNGGRVEAVVGGVAMPVAFNSTGGGVPVTFIVPPNTTYSCTFGSGALASWAELR